MIVTTTPLKICKYYVYIVFFMWLALSRNFNLLFLLATLFNKFDCHNDRIVLYNLALYNNLCQYNPTDIEHDTIVYNQNGYHDAHNYTHLPLY